MKRFKERFCKSLIGLIAASLATIAIGTLSVSANETNGLTVATKTTYSTSRLARVEISVQNNNGFTVENVNPTISNADMRVSYSGEIGDLEPGETKIMNATLSLKSKSSSSSDSSTSNTATDNSTEADNADSETPDSESDADSDGDTTPGDNDSGDDADSDDDEDIDEDSDESVDDDTDDDASSSDGSSDDESGNDPIPKTGVDFIFDIIMAVVMLGVTVSLFIGRKRIIKSKTARSIIAFILAASVVTGFIAVSNPFTANAEGTDELVSVITKSVVIGGKTYDFDVVVSVAASSFEESEAPLSATEADAADIITRGEWVGILIDVLDIALGNPETDTFDYYFYGDTARMTNTDLAYAVEVLNLYGFLPEGEYNEVPDDVRPDPEADIPFFNADTPLTREYAAFTIVHALDFLISASDMLDTGESLKYPGEDGVAVKQGIFRLREGQFYPDAIVSRSNLDVINAKIALLKNAREVVVPETPEVTVEYKSNIISGSLASVNNYTVSLSNGVYTVTMPKSTESGNLRTGDLFVLPANSEYVTGIALKITNITESGENYVITGEVPGFDEIYNEISYAGPIDVNLENITASGSGTDVSFDANGSLDNGGAAPININSRFNQGINGVLTLTFNNEEIAAGVRANGTVKIEIPNITGKIDANKPSSNNSSFKVDELLLSASTRIKTDLTITGGTANEKIAITDIPIVLGDSGLGISLKYYTVLDTDGNIAINSISNNTVGFQYTNGSIRLIANDNSVFSFENYENSAKIGVKSEMTLKSLEVFNIAVVDIENGVKLEASSTPHPAEGITCVNGAAYSYVKLDIERNGDLSGDFFRRNNIQTHFEINNSNVRLMHNEVGGNGIVDSCGFIGSISGLVQERVEGATSATPKPGARVTLKNDLGRIVGQTYTSATGQFTFNNIPVGTYSVTVNVSGLNSITSGGIAVVYGQDTICDNFELISRPVITAETTEGTLIGQFRNATNNALISNVTYKIRRNWNMTSGEVFREGVSESGDYSVVLPYGSYTIEASAEGYFSFFENITIMAGATTLRNIILNPETATDFDDDLFRIILTWGETPRDLDSHLYGPKVNDIGMFHVYYGNKTYYDASGTSLSGDDSEDASGTSLRSIADLDVDDTSSYGPETTTIRRMNESGIYKFYIHDYTNGGSTTSTQMSMSGAKVRVYKGSALIATYNVPTNIAATIWHVFDYNAATGVITPINTFGFGGTPGAEPPVTGTSTPVAP